MEYWQKRLLYFPGVVLFFGLSLLQLPAVDAQPLTLTGRVRDRNTYDAVAGVNIFLKGTSLGTTTDKRGRFRLFIPARLRHGKVVFQHIAYERLELPVDSLRKHPLVELQARVITLPGVAVEAGAAERPKILADLPQTFTIVEARDFRLRGYVDAGDLLQNDFTVQVDEQISGSKRVSIRGGNPDDVLILYNGIQLNNAFDNTFDLSLIDLEDIGRLEIVRGSNSALYGAQAFSGIINIVPKFDYDYTVRFQQRLGTYQSGNWSLHFFHPLGPLRLAYNLKRSGAKRSFADSPGEFLKNTAQHQLAQIRYRASGHNFLGLSEARGIWLKNRQKYTNSRNREELNRNQELASVRLLGKVGRLPGINIMLSSYRLTEGQRLRLLSGDLQRQMDNRSLYLNFEQSAGIGALSWHWAYQYEWTTLHFEDRRGTAKLARTGLEAAKLQRLHHGAVLIMKVKENFPGTAVQQAEFDWSLRADYVRDSQLERRFRQPNRKAAAQPAAFKDHFWREVTAKFGLQLLGYKPNLLYKGYMNFGTSAKFPTLFQQISSPAVLFNPASRPHLSPEKNRSLELGTEITREFPAQPKIYGWQIQADYFLNYYDNKFRMFTAPGIPVVFYDNVLTARIAGLESSGKLFLFRKKLTLSAGIARYFISEKAAFPFRAETKRTVDVALDHAGFSLQVHAFSEGQEVGWLRQMDGTFVQVILPPYSNLDVYFSKAFLLKKLRFSMNFSARNLLSRATLLQGLALRDRRYYLTLAAQI